MQRKMNEGNKLDVKLISKKESITKAEEQKSKHRITNNASDNEIYFPKRWRQCLSAHWNISCQFAKQYLYFICQREPKFDQTVTKNFAYSFHVNGEFCKVPGGHYHIIASNYQLPDTFKSTASKRFSIPISSPVTNTY